MTRIRKADQQPEGPDLVAVYDQGGNLIGVADSSRITPVGATAAGDEDEPPTKEQLAAETSAPAQADIAKALNVAAVRRYTQLRPRPTR